MVIAGGHVGRRRKGPSKARRPSLGTPLTGAEAIPWGGRRLIVGTGAERGLPLSDDLYAEAERRGIEIIALATPDACHLLAELAPPEVYAVLHVTC